MVSRLAGLCVFVLIALPVASKAQTALSPAFRSGPGGRVQGYTGAPSYRSTYGWSPYTRYRPDDPATEELQPSGGDQPHERSGPVRTLCVRMCDGFYFPISSAASRSELARDADKCSALCSTEASLFYYSAAGGGIDTMVDLMGRAYTSLPNAFKYRKTLVRGCQCRPQPWTEAELQRHRGYESGVVVSGHAVTEAVSQRADGEPEIAPTLAGLERLEPTDVVPSPSAGVEDGGITVITNHRVVPFPLPAAREVQVPPSWYGSPARSGVSRYGDGARR